MGPINQGGVPKGHHLFFEINHFFNPSTQLDKEKQEEELRNAFQAYRSCIKGNVIAFRKHVTPGGKVCRVVLGRLTKIPAWGPG